MSEMETTKFEDGQDVRPTGGMHCVLCDLSLEERTCSTHGIPTIPSFDWKPEDDIQGRILSERYVPLAEIGSGAAARVFSAWDLEEECPVALKVIRRPDDTELIERFRREAIATKRFDHPNIVSMKSAGSDAKTGVLFLVLEQLEGRPLDRLIAAEAPVSPQEAFRLMIPVCEALQAIHVAQLIHRDMKPANLYVSRTDSGDERVKILDFGITRFVGEDPVDSSLAAGRVLGSVIYASPEQALRKPLDVRSDLYALGVILYELLLGLPPFDKEDPLETLKAHVEEATPLLPLEFPRDVADLVESLLEKDPNRRPQSAIQILAAMDRILGRLQRTSLSSAEDGNPEELSSLGVSGNQHPLGQTTGEFNRKAEPAGAGSLLAKGALSAGALAGLAGLLWWMGWI